MTQEITNPQMCLLMRSGIQLWIDLEKAEKIKPLIGKGIQIDIDGEVINGSDISGLYNPQTIYELNKSKSGQWKCEHLNWIPRGKKCQCLNKPEYRDY